MKKRTLSARLKNKTRSASAQAALTSAAIHVLLVLFAGSIVAVRYVQKQNAELIARTETRPKLDRRPLQTPQKVEQLQKRALTSRLVSKKVSFSNPEFVLPDTGAIGSLNTQKVSLPGTDASRALRNLARMPGLGPSRIDFFGLRAEGEKAVFIIDASAAMLDDRTGGTGTYEYIKEEMAAIVSRLNPSVLFNVIFHDQTNAVLFRPAMVPAARGIAQELAAWMKPILADPESPGLDQSPDQYTFPFFYDTAVGKDAQSWLLALQAAMEQRPDAVFLLGPGWGSHRISPEKAQRLLDYALLELLVGNVIGGAPVLGPDRKLRDDLLKGAIETIRQEEKQRESNRGSPGYVRDIAQYVEYSRDQVLEHLDAVAKISHTEKGLSKPFVHYVRLAESGDMIVAGGAVQHLWALTGRYGGKLGVLHRDTLRTRTADDGQESGRRPSTTTSFFGVEQRAARAAFILDVSAQMLSEETGGFYSFNLIKKQIRHAAAALPPEALFNVFLCSGNQLALFKPEMTPAEPDRIAELGAWLASVHRGPEAPGVPDEMWSPEPANDYGTVVGADAADWLRAVQTAVEQQADAVFIVGPGWGTHPVGREKGRKLLDFSVWEAWSSGLDDKEEEQVDTPAAAVGEGVLGNMQQDKALRDALLKEALNTIEAEDAVRKAKGLPPPFVRDVLSYLSYPAPQVSEHIQAVVQANSAGTPPPVIHFITLVPGAAPPSVRTLRDLRRLTADYQGSLIFLRGAGTAEEMRRMNRDLDLTDW